METETEGEEASSSRFSTLKSLVGLGSETEHQQAVLRLVVGFFFFCYLLYITLSDGALLGNDLITLIGGGIFFVCAFGIITWLVLSPEVSVPRRLAGIVVDNGAATAVLYFLGELGAPLFIVYLWVSFGNGFRFGEKYLAFSAGCAVLGFSFAALASPSYSLGPYVTFGILVGLIVLPFYVAVLLRQLRRTLELARSASRAKSNFLATMSHEIRTPLNGVVGISEMLSRTSLDNRQRHYVEMIGRSSEWLMRVISDGLDFSKIEAGEFLLVNEPFGLKEVLEDLGSLYQGVEGDSDVELVVELDPDLPEQVVGDQLRLTQVVGNLLTNSFKFTERGVVRLAVKVTSRSPRGVRVLCSVEDTGPGIDPEKQALVFEPFRQEESGTVKRYGGTGLGLTIADRIVRLMGGELTLESEVGVGSCFRFEVEFELPDPDETDLAVHIEQPSAAVWQRPPRILLVEDHEINQEVVVHQLEMMGCEVVLASNGQEAVEKAMAGGIDAVLMDCQMPVLDGYEATKAIRQAEQPLQDGKSLPIIALTAHVTLDDRKRCLACGMDDYLGKPFRTRDLWIKLVRWLPFLLRDAAASPALADQDPAAVEEPAIPVAEHDDLSKRKLLHDLNNMLFSIQGSAELYLAAQQKDAERQHVEIIYKAVRKANSLVARLEEERTE